MAASVQERAKRIRLVALDVDGVLTNGEIIYTSAGDEIKAFNVKDGLGVTLAIRGGLEVAIITARQSPMTERRAAELGIRHLLQGQKDKRAGLYELTEKLNIPAEAMAYMGDDLPDLPALQTVGLAACPADAVASVKEACHWVSACDGGRGAVRELMELILSAQGQ